MKDQLSALMDDEMDLDAAAPMMQALNADGELRRCWSTYHLIGDTMRGAPVLSNDFQQRLMQRIAEEPAILAPRRHTPLKPSWTLSAAASVAAVMFVGWVALHQRTATETPATIAQNTPHVAQSTMSPDTFNSYLLAHLESSPEGSAPTAYYVQPAAYSEPGR